MRLNIWYFWYYSYVQFLTSELMIKIDLTGMKMCEMLHFRILYHAITVWVNILCCHIINIFSIYHKTISCSTNNMPTSNWPSGSWSKIQEEELRQLICTGEVDFKNRNPDYLYQITQQHFPDLISPGAKGKNAAIQCLWAKFLQYE